MVVNCSLPLFVLGRVDSMGTFWQLMLYGIIGAVFASYLQRRKAKKAAEEQASE
jgi:phosphotransferase system  glucose/maltose/N-acetylglucosamine-specific IIC component